MRIQKYRKGNILWCLSWLRPVEWQSHQYEARSYSRLYNFEVDRSSNILGAVSKTPRSDYERCSLSEDVLPTPFKACVVKSPAFEPDTSRCKSSSAFSSTSDHHGCWASSISRMDPRCPYGGSLTVGLKRMTTTDFFSRMYVASVSAAPSGLSYAFPP